MAPTTKIRTVILTISFDRSQLNINAGETWEQANDPESCLLFSNREEHKTALVVEILQKLTISLQEGADGINLAVDGRIILQGSSSTSSSVPAAVVNASKIDLNQATTEQLQTLPGVGPALATAIIRGRTYATVEDLLKISGIGEAKMAEIRPLVQV